MAFLQREQDGDGGDDFQGVPKSVEKTGVNDQDETNDGKFSQRRFGRPE